MNLASRLITLLIVLSTLQVSGQDTIWYKKGGWLSEQSWNNKTVQSGWVSHLYPTKNRIYFDWKERYHYSRNYKSWQKKEYEAKLNQIQELNINGYRYTNKTDWKTLPFNKYPYLQILNGSVGYERTIELPECEYLDGNLSASNQKLWVTLYREIDFLEKGYTSLSENDNSLTITYEPYRRGSDGGKAKITTQLYFRQGKIQLKSEVVILSKHSSLRNLKKISLDGANQELIECYHKHPELANRRFVEMINNAISHQVYLVESVIPRFRKELQKQVLEIQRQKRLDEAAQDFRNYLSTARIHPLEGIWSVDVRIDEDHDFNFTSQAFQIGIKRFGDGFISVPLQSGTPQYERSVKVFQRTAEPNVFLMQGYFPDHDYISTATVYQKSDGVVDFSMQLPKAEVRRIAKAYSSTYDGDLKLTYRLIKVFPMPDSDVPEKDKEEPEHWTATGSGFAVSANGLVATNYHVIEGGKTIHVRGVNGKSNQKLIAEVVAKDKQKDLAILKITDKNFTKTNELPYSLSTTDEKMGAEVFSLGFPKPGVFGDEPKFTDGKVSATKGLLDNEMHYQMTVPITYGNSGGPIFNKLGQVIGVSVAGTLDVELLTASYSIKSKYLIDLLKTVTEYTPASKEPSTTSLEDQIEAYKNFVYLIEVSSE
jgi:hypothetical protein